MIKFFRKLDKTYFQKEILEQISLNEIIANNLQATLIY